MVTSRSNNLKRIIAMLMAMILLLGMLPISGVTAATGNHPSAVTISVKDSDGVAVSGASVHYVITGEIVETIDNTKTTDQFGTVEVLASEKFAEGTYKISATISCDTYVTVTLSERDISSADQDFVVTMEKEEVKPDPKPITGITVTATEEKYTGAEFPAVKITGTQTGDVVTVTVDGNATVLNTNGSNMPKIKEVGSYEVKVDVSREGFADYTKTVTSVISKNTLVINYEGINEAYTGEEFDAIKLADGTTPPAVDSITYKLENGVVSASIPKISAVGSYKIYVHAEKAGYEDFDQVYTSTITLGAIDDSNVTITGLNSVYNGNAQQLITISGSDKDLFTYSFKVAGDETIYTSEKDLSKTDAGSYEVTVTLSRENYADKDVVVNATIARAPQTISFALESYEDGGSATVPFIEKIGETPFDFSVVIESGTEPDVNYSLQYGETDDESENNFASIDENGQLTITGVGTVTIVATQAEDSNYESAEISFTLSVSPPSNSKFIKFNEMPVCYVLGTNHGLISDRVAERVPVSDYGIQDKGKITYHFLDDSQAAKYGIDLNTSNRQAKVIVEDYAALTSAMEENNGSVSIFVVAEKAEWVMYDVDSASYKITIQFAECDSETPYTLKENIDDADVLAGPNGENGWYGTEVVVLPAEGYTLTREINKRADNFAENVTIADQGEEEKYIYLKNTKGGICSKVLLEGLKIDSVNPTDCTVEYKDPSVGKTILRALSLGFYQSSVEVTFTANDATSGVAYFKWWYVREEGVNENNAPSVSWKKAVPATPITEDVEDEETEEIHTVIKGYTATITLTTEEYNQMRGKIFAVAVDFAGHESDESNDDTGFVLDDINPTMTLEYTEANRTVGDKKYYNNQIDFTLRITENNFFSEDVNVTVNGVETSVTWSENDSSSNLHTGKFTIGTEKDGDYTVKIDYKDKSGNPMEPEETYTVPYTLVIDTTKPVITPTYQNTSSEEQQLVLTVDEHNFNAADIEVGFVAKSITGADITVNQTEVLAYIRNPNNWTTSGDTHTLTAKDFSDANYTLTFNYKDLATNPADEKSSQFTIDHTAPDSARMTVTYSDSLQDTLLSGLTLGFYQPQVTVTFTAYDVTSGVKSFVWGYNRQEAASTINLDADTGTLNAVQDSKDKTKYTASIALPRDDANQLRGNIYFTATDNKDNTSQTVTDNGTVLVVDSIAPRITNTAYSTPSATVGTERYYNNPATLTLTFNEANFFQEDVQIVITREGGGTSQATVAWVNNSVDEHVATITFPAPAGGGADGHYTVTANYTDRSGNRMTTFTSDRITVDTTAPTISVSYDNNDLTNENYFTEAENAKFFKAGREATITIVEHNFDSNKVTISAVAAGHGAETPAISGWTDSGDTHTAKITFSADGDYTFDVAAIDIAENKSGDVDYRNSAAPKEFTIDTNPDMIVIAPDSVVEGKAYTYDDVIIPDITISDDNLEGYEITLKGVQRGNEIDLTEQVNDLAKNEDNLATALLDVFSKKAELDGIYTLTVRSTDLSDNTDEKVIRFTVNRFGSVYEYSDSLMDLIENGGTYNRSLDEDLTFTIYNASPIDPNNVSVVITRDGRPVEAIFTVVETTADDDGWYSYLVTINKGNFAEDGVYTVSVTTTDDADNTVENTVDNSDGDILFYVDSTAPQLTSVSGLEERIVNATELEVSYTVYDTIGLASVQVKVDGEIVDSATDFDDASNYSGKFTIYEKSSEQHVSFVLTDKAGNVTESDAEGFEVPYTLEKDVTVSTNLFVRWFANKPLFFGGIGGGVAVLGGLGALLGLKKKKKVKVS